MFGQLLKACDQIVISSCHVLCDACGMGWTLPATLDYTWHVKRLCMWRHCRSTCAKQCLPVLSCPKASMHIPTFQIEGFGFLSSLRSHSQKDGNTLAVSYRIWLVSSSQCQLCGVGRSSSKLMKSSICSDLLAPFFFTDLFACSLADRLSVLPHCMSAVVQVDI